MEFIFSARTISQAIQKGLEALKLSDDDVVVKVKKQPKTFQDAVVALCVDENCLVQSEHLMQLANLQKLEEEIKATQKKVAKSHREKNNILEAMLANQQSNPHTELKKFVVLLFENNQVFGVRVEVDEDEENVNVRVFGKGLLKQLNHNWHKVYELQSIVGDFLQNNTNQTKRVVLDINNLRAKRKRFVEHLAKTAADKVLATNQAEELQPMNAYERRLVHSIATSAGLGTESRGEEPNRFVVILPKQ